MMPNAPEDREGAFATGGRVFWGRRGAGALLLARDTGRVLALRRSRSVMEPRTWGIAGGAIDSGEDPEKSARREVQEELDYYGPVEMHPAHVFQSDAFRYHNFIGIVPVEFKPRLNWENDLYRWVDIDEMPEPRHYGLKALFDNSGDLIRRLIAERNDPRPNPSFLLLNPRRRASKKSSRRKSRPGYQFGVPPPVVGGQVYRGRWTLVGSRRLGIPKSTSDIDYMVPLENVWNHIAEFRPYSEVEGAYWKLVPGSDPEATVVALPGWAYDIIDGSYAQATQKYSPRRMRSLRNKVGKDNFYRAIGVAYTDETLRPYAKTSKRRKTSRRK